MAFIEVSNLVKNYNVLTPCHGIKNRLKNIGKKNYYVKEAVRGISFSVEKGETIGYIGFNGAGKSTTIKMMTGVLQPTSGTIKVDGIEPYIERKINAKKIGVVFGQRSQLYWDLPVYDSFELARLLYNIPNDRFKKNAEKFIELFKMEDFINQPVRQLSLGQKIKANIVMALLHDPEVVYLDEPTIGLDIISKKAIREGITAINKENNTTIILTSHDMDDISAVCNRIILIDRGSIVYDGSIKDFQNKFDSNYVIKLEFNALPKWIPTKKYTLESQEKNTWKICVNKSINKKDVMIDLINMYSPDNIYILDHSLEDIIGKYMSNL